MTPQPSGASAGASRRGRILRGLLAAFVVLVLLVSGGVAYAYHHLAGNITTIGGTENAGASGVERPSASSPSPSKGAAKVDHKPLNILILGSDTRDGENQFIGGSQGIGRSDTAIVLHLSADRKWAVGVSIPRDSMVQLPPCKKPDGEPRRRSWRCSTRRTPSVVRSAPATLSSSSRTCASTTSWSSTSRASATWCRRSVA